MASLKALSLTKHRRVGIPGFAPKGEPALTHVPLQPPLEVLLLLLLQWDPQAQKPPALPTGKVRTQQSGSQAIRWTHKAIHSGMSCYQFCRELSSFRESVLLGLSTLSFILPYTIGDGSRRPRQQGSSWLFPVGGAHGPTYARTL